MTDRFPLLVCLTVAVVVGSVSGESTHSPEVPAQAVAGPAAIAHDELVPVDDPFPIRRLRATEAQLADILKQPDSGPLVRLPRGDFESRVRAAGRTAAEARDLPRITETRWKASLVGNDLVGNAELEVMHASAVAAFLPLDPLRLALGPVAWADGRDAVLGLPTGGTTAGVWVTETGRRTLRFGWSVGGTSEPGEQRFELRVPACPTALLELELPAGRVPAVMATDVLLTGPFAVPRNPDLARWQFRFGGRSRLDFAVRAGGNPGVVAAAVLKAVYDLTPGQLTCAFEYELRPAKGTVGEWEFTVDPGLHVTNVEVNNRAGWTVDSPPEPNASRKLRVLLRQPGAGGKVLISATAPHPDPARPGNGPLPGIRPVGANLDDETLTIRFAPELRPASWNPGDYRIIDSDSRSDQARELTLTGTLSPQGSSRAFRRLPTVRTLMPEAEFTTLERLTWRLEADRVTVTARMAVRVRRGPLFQFALSVPAGYTFDRLTATPEEVVGSSEVAGGNVLVEFARPLATGQRTELTFEFRGPPLTPGSHRIPIPVFTPARAAERAGVIGVFPDAVWTAEVQPGVGTVPVGWFDLAAPLPDSGAQATFRYQGDDPDGWVTLTPVRAEFAVDVTARVESLPQRLQETTAFAIRVAHGGLSVVAIRESAGATRTRTWRVARGRNAIAGAVPLPMTLFAWPCALAKHTETSEWLWLVRFTRPATTELTLETTASIATDAHTDSTTLADRSSTELTMLGATQSRVAATTGVRHHESPIAAPAWGFSGLYLVTAVRTSRDVVVVFGGTATSTSGGVLPITLPEGAEVRAAAVGGRWIDPGRSRLSEGVLHLPIAAGSARFEVRYRLPVEPGTISQAVRSPIPGLPSQDLNVQRWWAFGREVLPGWPVRAWDRDSIDDLPELLGESPAGGHDAVVWRSPVEEVRVASVRFADAAGVALTALMFALAWAGGVRRHLFCGTLAIAGLLAVGAGLMLGPPWWQRAAFVPLIVGLIAAAGMVVARGHRSRLPSAIATAVLLCLLSRSDTVAQPVAPATVVILPADAKGREVVVAPKALLDRLAAAARPTSPGVIVTAAEYTATADDTTARVTAKFAVHAFQRDAVATLPLTDARLERVTVNGDPAFPASPRPGAYTVPLPDAGRHEIEVAFTVPVGGTGTEREFRFGVPETPTAKLTADLSSSAKQVQVVGRIGRQTVTPGKRGRLEADIGAVRAVHVRWRDGAGSTALVKVREGCVWDVTEDGAELTACYLVRIDQGAVSTLRYDIPAELDVLGVAIRSLDAGSTAALRDWSLAVEQNGFRQLRLDFRVATAGRVLVVLTLAPQQPITRQPALRFPKVVGVGDEPDAVYGLRVKGVVVEELGRGGVIDFSPDALTRDFADDLRLDPQTPVRVFRPIPSGTPVLRPTLRVAGEAPSLTLDTVWHLGQHRADADGKVRWAGKDSATLIEFNVPVVKLAEVRGPEVATWTQNGSRVQVWLKRPAAEGEIAWFATVARPTFPFNAITPRPLSGPLVADTLRLAPAKGFGVEVERKQGWTADEQRPGFYQTTNPTAEPIRVHVVPVPPTLRDDELGWLSPKPKTALPAMQPTSVSPPVISSQTPDEPTEPASAEQSRWVIPVSAATTWCAALVILAVLLVRWPRSTWPEQFGLIGGLFGAAVAGGWWVGVVAWAAARMVWLGEYASRPRPRESSILRTRST